MWGKFIQIEVHGGILTPRFKISICTGLVLNQYVLDILILHSTSTWCIDITYTSIRYTDITCVGTKPISDWYVPHRFSKLWLTMRPNFVSSLYLPLLIFPELAYFWFIWHKWCLLFLQESLIGWPKGVVSLLPIVIEHKSVYLTQKMVICGLIISNKK